MVPATLASYPVLVSVLLPLPRSTLPLIFATGLPGVVPLLLLLTTSLPLPSVIFPLITAGSVTDWALLLIVVVPVGLMLPVMVPLLVTRKVPPADVMFPVMPVPTAENRKFSSVLVWPVPAAPKLIAPIIEPVAVEASVTRLPPPIEMATVPAGAPVTSMPPSLLTTLVVPADRSGAAEGRVVPVTVAPGVTLIVSVLIDDWKPLVSAVVQVTVSFVALIRQSAKAGVGTRTPKPARAVPNFRYCFAGSRVSICSAPRC